MRRRAPLLFRALVPLALLTAASACYEDATNVETVTAFVVAGDVRDAQGGAVAGARVDVAWKPFACTPAVLEVAPPDTTDAEGRFAVAITAFGTFTSVCVNVTTVAPASFQAQAAPYQASVSLRRLDGPDTVTIHVALPAP